MHYQLLNFDGSRMCVCVNFVMWIGIRGVYVVYVYVRVYKCVRLCKSLGYEINLDDNWVA